MTTYRFDFTAEQIQLLRWCVAKAKDDTEYSHQFFKAMGDPEAASAEIQVSYISGLQAFLERKPTPIGIGEAEYLAAVEEVRTLRNEVRAMRGALEDIADSEDDDGHPSTREWMELRAFEVLHKLYPKVHK